MTLSDKRIDLREEEEIKTLFPNDFCKAVLTCAGHTIEA